jgi:DNA (cytosine-5)-methyltransferase 1
MMTHLSLFSGIGGLDIAAEMAGFQTVGQCEYADYPTKVLEKHWPNVPRWRDVRDLTAADFTTRTGLATVDCISGGFPCQPHSVAGKRKASADERDLWPEFRRVIGEIKPRWVVAENVPGLLSSEDGRFFRGILRDFAEMGFDVGWATFSAASVGAIHRRERVAIVAHSNSQSGRRVFSRKRIEKTARDEKERFWGGHREWIKQRTGITAVLPMGGAELIKPLVLRSDDGIRNKLDRNKCLGNSVVPQQFYPIFKAIAECEEDWLRELDGTGG